MATITSPNPPPPIKPEKPLNHVNINHFSQSDLLKLSTSSNSAFDLNDVVSPQLDRSLFNESAGSRRQTYSRLNHHRSHSRLHPSLKPYRAQNPNSDHVTHSIVHFFKHFLNGNHNPPPPPPPPEPEPPEQEVVVTEPVVERELGFQGLGGGDFKIKRRRKRRRDLGKKRVVLESVVDLVVELERVNGRGEVVDFERLGEKGDEMYCEELRRRTVGLETEEGALGFLWGLEGQWCSRRKKRKYVDAGVFGDALPAGWKMLLGLRRRDYRASVYCRRYVSPTGQQFVSCKDVASFLKAYFGSNDPDHQRDQKTCSIQQAYVVSCEKLQNAHTADKTNSMAHDVAPHSTSSNVHVNGDSLVGIENLPEVQVHDIFECVKCNLTFDEKNVYLQHLFSFHQKTTKRYRLGTTVGDGVIIRDGKFECQFCHKVFEERRSYNGHVGIHVRNAGKNTNELPTPVNVHKDVESQLHEELPTRSSKVDASIEIAQRSGFETLNVGTSEQATTNQLANALNLEESRAACSDHEANLSFDPIEIQTEDFDANRAQDEPLPRSSQAVTENNDMVTNDYQWDVDIHMDTNGLNDSERCGDVEKTGNSNLEMGLGSNDQLEDTPELTIGEIVFQDGGSSVPLAQSFEFFPSFDPASDKVEHDFSIVDQKLQNVAAFEELRFDDLEPFKYGFVNEQELQSLPGCSMNMGNDGRIEDGFNSSMRFGSEDVMLNSLEANQLTVCVWCRTEFKLEGIESETPSDSIGYMCPTCKSKISGHFGGGLSLDPHGF